MASEESFHEFEFHKFSIGRGPTKLDKRIGMELWAKLVDALALEKSINGWRKDWNLNKTYCKQEKKNWTNYVHKIHSQTLPIHDCHLIRFRVYAVLWPCFALARALSRSLAVCMRLWNYSERVTHYVYQLYSRVGLELVL